MADHNKQPSKPNYTMGYSEAEQQRLSLRKLDIAFSPGLI